MAWPFKKESEVPNPNPETPPEKTDSEKQAELIAQSIKAAIEPFAARFDAIETEVKGLKPPPRPEPNPEKISVLDDEDAAFNQRQAPLAEAVMETRADFVKREIKDANKEAWAVFAKDIEEELAKSPVQARMVPKYVQNVVDMVVGRKAKENGFRLNVDTGKFFVEDAGGAGTPVEEQKDGLTADQRRFLEKQGIPIERGAEMSKRLKYVH